MHHTSPHARSGRAVAATIDAYETELVLAGECSVINLLSGLVERAAALHASDIHIDPTASDTRVRLRIDGLLRDVPAIPRSVHNEVISRIKVLAGLRTDEHLLAQDGRFAHAVLAGDIRVSVAPTYYGENAVLRLLGTTRADVSLSGLGFSDPDCARIESGIARNHGMILVTGPTGSGKTTTLYGLLERINNPECSLATLEDPVEYSIEGVAQVQLHPRAGLTFASGLRSLLRQDPDVIMVGEIRDSETARVAINAALTGHLLLSSLHTTDALSTIARLFDMGIDPYLIAATLRLVVAQRLIRTLCSDCREVYMPSTSERGLLEDALGSVPPSSTIAKASGCTHCSGTGYKGRTVLAETLVVGSVLREAIAARAPTEVLAAHARTGGTTPLSADGMRKVLAGMTSIDEVLRVLHD